MTKDIQHYIEHEVKLRVQDERMKQLENAIKHIDSKFNWIVGICITSILIPFATHLIKLI